MDTINGISQPRTGDIADTRVRPAQQQTEPPGEAVSQPRPSEEQPVVVDEARTESTTKLSPEQVEGLVAELAVAMDEASPDPRSVSFRHDEENQDFVIEIKNRDTGEMITQFPPEKILNMRESLDELVGMVIDRKI